MKVSLQLEVEDLERSFGQTPRGREDLKVGNFLAEFSLGVNVFKLRRQGKILAQNSLLNFP